MKHLRIRTPRDLKCHHVPLTPITRLGELVGWVCACGLRRESQSEEEINRGASEPRRTARIRRD